jgi:hypothetical protein
MLVWYVYAYWLLHLSFCSISTHINAIFFLCVRSSVGYIVVTVFIPENEDVDSISEVLKILQKENPAWHPKNMMVDFSLAEIAAIDKCFPRTCTLYK